MGNEGYKLNIKNDRVFLNANTSAGLLYGMQSIWQLLSAKDGNSIPCMEITDYPRFSWRGMHLDVSRHFMPASFIYKYIDYIAMHKMNVFHWHLVDGQGWRIEIKKYPKLTEIGAWRTNEEDLRWGTADDLPNKDGEKYGGFYTQDEIRAIVEYAQKRNVTIVPEIEMPAHSKAALEAYPEFSCAGKHPASESNHKPTIYCAGNDSTFIFLEDILSEVMDLFPSTYIHIGGDEANKTDWKNCPKCQQRIKDEGLKDENELQSYFIKRIEKFLNSKGRRLIGWDEILEGGLAPEATVMSWRGESGGIEAAKMNHDVVMTPEGYLYFDRYQGDPTLEPKAFGGFTQLRRVYEYDPVPAELTEQEGKHVLGAQANVWSEYIPNEKHVEYMIMPRMAALSEILWSPKEARNWDDFSQRMETQYRRYEKMGVNYSHSAFQVYVHQELDPKTKSVKATLVTDAWNPDIRYTTDGSEPNINSKKYTGPIEIKSSQTLKGIVVKDGKAMTKSLATDVFIHKAIACPVTLEFPNAKKYNSTGEYALVDGIKGSKNFGDGRWKGFDVKDMVATIDLGKEESFSKVSVGVLQDAGNMIFYPTEIIVETSTNGKDFRKLGTVKNKVGTSQRERVTQQLIVKKKAKAQFIRITAKNLGMYPQGSGDKGRPAWLFVDEIVVE
ncbi:MAG: family 20 glycosylhydrolase [Spirochaetales bacterium]|nr:family 20 glycosylhydrolase [Spirochaetales bacterium]